LTPQGENKINRLSEILSKLQSPSSSSSAAANTTTTDSPMAMVSPVSLIGSGLRRWSSYLRHTLTELGSNNPLENIKSLLNTIPPHHHHVAQSDINKPTTPKAVDKSKKLTAKELQRKLAKTKPAGFNPARPFPGMVIKDENERPIVKTELNSGSTNTNSGKKLELIGLKVKFYKCHKCDEVYTTATDRDRHMTTSHFECKECQQSFHSAVCFEVHTAFGHGPFHCELCPVSFATFAQRERHRLTHCTSSLIFLCRECGAKFGSHEATVCHRVLYPGCRKRLRRPLNRADHKAQKEILELVRRQVFIYRGPINQTVIVV